MEGGSSIWPAMSPDLNIIEHLWPMVLQKIKGRSYATKDALWASLKVAFRQITPAQVQALYRSIPDRLQAVLVSRGGPTRY